MEQVLCFQWGQLAAAQWCDWRALQPFRGAVNSPQKQVLYDKSRFTVQLQAVVCLCREFDKTSSWAVPRESRLSFVCATFGGDRVSRLPRRLSTSDRHRPSSPPPPLCVIKPVTSTSRSMCGGTRVSWHTNGPPWKRSGNTRPDTEPLLQRTLNIWKRWDEKHCILATIGPCREFWQLFFGGVIHVIGEVLGQQDQIRKPVWEIKGLWPWLLTLQSFDWQLLKARSVVTFAYVYIDTRDFVSGGSEIIYEMWPVSRSSRAELERGRASVSARR